MTLIVSCLHWKDFEVLVSAIRIYYYEQSRPRPFNLRTIPLKNLLMLREVANQHYEKTQFSRRPCLALKLDLRRVFILTKLID